MKILHSADWHILLHKKNVPYEWQKNRFEMFFEKIFELEKECDIHIIAGDVFEKKPTQDEVALAYKFFNRATIPSFVIPGNHEATKKGSSFLEDFAEDFVIDNPNLKVITKNTQLNIQGQEFTFFPYGEMQLDKLPEYIEDSILVTHIRGEVPPHVSPEYDFEKIRKWGLVLIGDLHFNHKYKDFNVYYSGSPMNVTFDRTEENENGVNIVDFRNINDYDVKFVPLNLPRLVRKTINVNDEMVKHDFHHVVYEVTGSLDELSKIKNNELLDKKISHSISSKSKLNLTNKTEIEELDLYLDHIKIKNKKEILEEYNNL